LRFRERLTRWDADELAASQDQHGRVGIDDHEPLADQHGMGSMNRLSGGPSATGDRMHGTSPAAIVVPAAAAMYSADGIALW
jgi:hypothetical protein